MTESMNTTKTIGTHNGSFHADEALACYILRLTKEFKDAKIVRTRDEKVLATLDAAVDVGSVYDPERRRFDHHQKSFTDTFNDQYTTRLSSAGLIYKHYGREVIGTILETGDEQVIELIFNKVYKTLIEGMDAIDNGIDCYPTDIKPKYIVNTDLGARVKKLNPWWNQTDVNPDERFMQAVEIAGKEFSDSVTYFGKSWLPARSIVENALKNRFEVDPSGEIIELERFAPWMSHLYEIEEQTKIEPSVKFALYTDTNGVWRLHCVSVPGTFENRVNILWGGLREEELVKESGIPGCVFVHNTGFICGNRTREGALEMGRRSLQARNEAKSSEPEAKRTKSE